MNSLNCITITAYQRPHYFERLLKSLIQNELTGWPIHIQLEPSEHIDSFLEICERLLSPYDYFIGINSKRLGVRNNPYSLLKKTFSQGATCCIYLEEDLIVSKDITQIAAWYLRQDLDNILALNLLFGGCFTTGFLSDTSLPNAFIRSKALNSLGLIITSDQWHKHIKPHWYQDSTYAINIHGKKVTGWDMTLFDYLLQSNTLHTLQPISARATHIGREGGEHASATFHDRAFSDLPLGAGDPTQYHIVDNPIDLPFQARSHVFLQSELCEALKTLHTLNKLLGFKKKVKKIISACLRLKLPKKKKDSA